MKFFEFKQRLGLVNDVLSAVNLLVWDSRTMMPPGGVASRGQQIATLTILARQMLIADETRRLLDAAERETQHEPPDSAARRMVEQTRAAIDHHLRVPEALERRRAELRTEAQAAWIDARANNDFAQFEPLLAETFALARQLADAIGNANHPYDAMLSLFEPGETIASPTSLFTTLRAGLLPLIAQAPPPRGAILTREYPEAGQRAFGLRVAERFGYDLSRGRLDPTVHPFEISFTREDVRITTVYDCHNLAVALRGITHEAGHGIYEQGVDPVHTRTPLATDLIGLYAVGGSSFGAHESQSRLRGNHIGRSRRFWEHHYADQRDTFPDALNDVSVDDFIDAYNSVEPGPIRVRADELTYDLHLMLRVAAGARLARRQPARARPARGVERGDAARPRRAGFRRPEWGAAGHPLGGRLHRLVLHLHRRQRHGSPAVCGGGRAGHADRGRVGHRRLRAAATVADRGRLPARPPLLARRTACARHRPPARSV